MDGAQTHTTAHLLDQLRAGDRAAREALFARCLAPLQRWAHGRLPATARSLSDTNDLVQVTLVRALNRIDQFDPRQQGSFLAYLRNILLNIVRDELRRSGRSGLSVTLSAADRDGGSRLASPVEQAVGAEEMESYEQALDQLPPAQRDAVVLRVEFGMSFPEIAEETGRSSDAARMLFNRGWARLVEVLEDSGGEQR